MTVEELQSRQRFAEFAKYVYRVVFVSNDNPRHRLEYLVLTDSEHKAKQIALEQVLSSHYNILHCYQPDVLV